MKRALAITVAVLLSGVACGVLPWTKSGPEQTFIVFSSDTIGELKPCG
jgi:hypothetical protein